MFIEICLAIIAASFVMLAFILFKVAAQAKTSIHKIQLDLNRISTEVARLTNSLDEFVKIDLHNIAKETSGVLQNIKNLSVDVNNKSRSLNCLFKPFEFLTSKINSNSTFAVDSSSRKSETIPQILKWIATGAFLIKTTREVVKKI